MKETLWAILAIALVIVTLIGWADAFDVIDLFGEARAGHNWMIAKQGFQVGQTGYIVEFSPDSASWVIVRMGYTEGFHDTVFASEFISGEFEKAKSCGHVWNTPCGVYTICRNDWWVR